MGSDNWMDDTVPVRRVGAEGGAGDDDVPSSGVAQVVVWLLGFAVVFVAAVGCGLWALYLSRGRTAGDGPTPTAIIWTPTAVPVPVASPSPPLPEASELTPTVSPEIAVGQYVRVTGTGGAGLNLRSGPGTNYPREDIALEGDLFIVTDGPTVSGGSEWWMIQDLEDEGQTWWAVANFLEPVE